MYYMFKINLPFCKPPTFILQDDGEKLWFSKDWLSVDSTLLVLILLPVLSLLQAVTFSGIKNLTSFCTLGVTASLTVSTVSSVFLAQGSSTTGTLSDDSLVEMLMSVLNCLFIVPVTDELDEEDIDVVRGLRMEPASNVLTSL